MMGRVGTFIRTVRRHVFGDYRVERVVDVPDAPREHLLYAIADPRQAPWAVAFVCPCGCGAIIQLALVVGGGPSWRLHRDWLGRPSLHPSIWRVRGCRSHFWLRRGLIEWVSDDIGLAPRRHAPCDYAS